MNKNDLRVKKTIQNLKNSLLILLKEKEIKEITVKDICDKAQCSRNAFYSHYMYKEDLYEELLMDCYETIRYAFHANVEDEDMLDYHAFESYILSILNAFTNTSDTLLTMLKRDKAISKIKYIMKY